MRDSTTRTLMLVSGVGLSGLGLFYSLTGDAPTLSNVGLLIAGVLTAAYPRVQL